jgi:hypothetical protein
MYGPAVRRAASLCLLLACLTLSLPATAANKPCSGRKGGVSHCQGDTFVCNDGSVSASKRSCSASSGGGFARACGTIGRAGGRRQLFVSFGRLLHGSSGRPLLLFGQRPEKLSAEVRASG